MAGTGFGRKPWLTLTVIVAAQFMVMLAAATIESPSRAPRPDPANVEQYQPRRREDGGR
jgi:hypothetical protein